MSKTTSIKTSFRKAFATVVNSVTQFANAVAEIPGLQGIFEAASQSDWETVSSELNEPCRNQRELAGVLTESSQNKGLVSNLCQISRAGKWSLLSESQIDGNPVSVNLVARLSRGQSAKRQADPIRRLDGAIKAASKLQGRTRSRAILSLLDGLELLGVDVSNIDV